MIILPLENWAKLKLPNMTTVKPVTQPAGYTGFLGI